MARDERAKSTLLATFTEVVWSAVTFESWLMPEPEPMAGSSMATSSQGFSGVLVGDASRATGSPPPPVTHAKSSGCAATAVLAEVSVQDDALLNSRSSCCIML